jgi:hypothetical protein
LLKMTTNAFQDLGSWVTRFGELFTLGRFGKLQK